jgi:hypothetical protein
LINYHVTYLRYGAVSYLHQFTGFVDAVPDKKILGTYVQYALEYLARIGTVDIAESGDLLHAYLFVVMFFDKIQGFTDIKFPQAAASYFFRREEEQIRAFIKKYICPIRTRGGSFLPLIIARSSFFISSCSLLSLLEYMG